jgi:arylformamidase
VALRYQFTTVRKGSIVTILPYKLVDLSIELDAANFKMRTYAGFKKDMQFELETIKEYPGGLGQIVRGVHMRLHAGSHVDAPSHMLEGAPDMHEMPLERFIGPAIVADIRQRKAGEEITADDFENAIGAKFQKNDRVLLRTDQNGVYDGSSEWMARAPYMGFGAVDWCIERGVSILGYDFYHGGMPPNSEQPYYGRRLSEHGIMTMPYLTNLGAVGTERFTLVSLPLKMIGVEASPIRAVGLVT